jgi:hypothetical protein
MARGAQQGNQHRKGHFRKYEPRLVATIRDLTGRGYSIREIAEAISGDTNGHLTQSTVQRIQKLHSMTKGTVGPHVSITPVIALERTPRSKW